MLGDLAVFWLYVLLLHYIAIRPWPTSTRLNHPFLTKSTSILHEDAPLVSKLSRLPTLTDHRSNTLQTKCSTTTTVVASRRPRQRRRRRWPENRRESWAVDENGSQYSGRQLPSLASLYCDRCLYLRHSTAAIALHNTPKFSPRQRCANR